jgi:hypothetical protein
VHASRVGVERLWWTRGHQRGRLARQRRCYGVSEGARPEASGARLDASALGVQREGVAPLVSVERLWGTCMGLAWAAYPLGVLFGVGLMPDASA